MDLDVALEGNDAKGSVQLSLRYSPLTGIPGGLPPGLRGSAEGTIGRGGDSPP